MILILHCIWQDANVESSTSNKATPLTALAAALKENSNDENKSAAKVCNENSIEKTVCIQPNSTDFHDLRAYDVVQGKSYSDMKNEERNCDTKLDVVQGKSYSDIKNKERNYNTKLDAVQGKSYSDMKNEERNYDTKPSYADDTKPSYADAAKTQHENNEIDENKM